MLHKPMLHITLEGRPIDLLEQILNYVIDAVKPDPDILTSAFDLNLAGRFTPSSNPNGLDLAAGLIARFMRVEMRRDDVLHEGRRTVYHFGDDWFGEYDGRSFVMRCRKQVQWSVAKTLKTNLEVFVGQGAP